MSGFRDHKVTRRRDNPVRTTWTFKNADGTSTEVCPLDDHVQAALFRKFVSVCSETDMIVLESMIRERRVEVSSVEFLRAAKTAKIERDREMATRDGVAAEGEKEPELARSSAEILPEPTLRVRLPAVAPGGTPGD